MEYPEHVNAKEFFSKRPPIGEYTWKIIEETPFTDSVIELLEKQVIPPARPIPIGTKVYFNKEYPVITIHRIFDSTQQFNEFLDTTFHPSLVGDKGLIMTTLIYPTEESN